MNKNQYDICIAGGGASGLMAAIAASGEGKTVCVLEKNEIPAKKIYATGNGRCNFTNLYVCPGDYLSGDEAQDSSAFAAKTFEKLYDFYFEKNECCMDRSLIGFSPKQIRKIDIAVHGVFEKNPSKYAELLLSLFGKLGISALCDEVGRCYPRSEEASSIAKALLRCCVKSGVQILCGFDIRSVERSGCGEQLYKVFSSDKRLVYCNNLVIALGGKAGLPFGTTGDGYRLAQSLDYQVFKPIPSLVRLKTDTNISAIAGVRCKAKLSLIKIIGGAENTVACDCGELQFSPGFLSGICSFNLSRYLRFSEGNSFELAVDFFPEYTNAELSEFFRQRILCQGQTQAAAFQNALFGLLPEKLCSYICSFLQGSEYGTDSTLAAHALCKLCKELRFSVTGSGSWKDAQLSCGGVALDQLDPESLRGKKDKGLFFAGEILDIDAPCGGYNLSWAFASGYLAGLAASGKIG